MREPLRSGASTTHTAIAMPASRRLRTGKCSRKGGGARRIFRHDHPVGSQDLLPQAAVGLGIIHVEATALHGDGQATARERPRWDAPSIPTAPPLITMQPPAASPAAMLEAARQP